MDSAFLSSLLLHPSRRALLVLGCDGELQLRNERAHELLPPEVALQLAPELAAARAQLREQPKRQVVGRSQTLLGELSWQLRAVCDARGELQGYTLSIHPSDDAEALAEAPERTRWHFALESAQDGLWDWSAETGEVFRSARCYTMLGYRPEDFGDGLGDWQALLHPDDRARQEAVLAEHVQGRRENYQVEYRVCDAEGRWRWILDRGKVVAWRPDGRPQRVLGTHTDITAFKELEEAARWRNDLLGRIARVGRIGGFELYLDSGELYWTEENYRIHGFEPGSPVSMASTIGHYDPASAVEMRRILAGAKSGQIREHAMEARFVRPDGQVVWLRIAGRLETRDGKPYRITGLTQDVTEEHEANERIEQLAHYDTLTGLPNRFLFNSRAQAAIAGARHTKQALALLFIDLDRFKNVNDSLGHQAGDALLVEVAGRIKSCVRGSDLVGRLSGDEFLVLLPEMVRPQDAALVAEKIIAALTEPVALSSGEVRIGCSVGIALLGEGGGDLDSLLRAADTAMYAAKDAGRNTWRYYDDSFFARVRRRVRLEQELRLALSRGELSLAYQPARGLRDGRIGGIEALLRWQGPDGEWRSPAEFIPIAEESGEILPIGRWVLQQALQQARAWDESGIEFARIAVNVSAVQLRDPSFAHDVLRLCEQAGWPPTRLELELTESALMRDSDILRQAFALFEQHGIA
ncbi:MAG TPA: diguanylate cyclase, partial [Arenimonas sp.]|nr:diguanylate cyclase [Arenimonas sp.]